MQRGLADRHCSGGTVGRRKPPPWLSRVHGSKALCLLTCGETRAYRFSALCKSLRHRRHRPSAALGTTGRIIRASRSGFATSRPRNLSTGFKGVSRPTPPPTGCRVSLRAGSHDRARLLHTCETRLTPSEARRGKLRRLLAGARKDRRSFQCIKQKSSSMARPGPEGLARQDKRTNAAPARISDAAPSCRMPTSSLRIRAEIAAPNRIEVSRRAETTGTGACVMAHSARP